MDYYEYFLSARNEYESSENASLKSFYQNPVINLTGNIYSVKYLREVQLLAGKVKEEFDKGHQSGLMLNAKDIWKYENHITNLSNIIVPFLEENRFGCNLYVDKIYIYRTLKIKKRESSYLWHYDNNPTEIVKNIIYLNDVSELNSPFEFLCDSTEKGLIMTPSRRGPNHWAPAENNSRITEKQINSLTNKGYSGKKVFGKIGTIYSFNNNAIHRVNPIIEGYRDVINIRVKPTIKKLENYVDRRWTTGHEKSGAVNPYPNIIGDTK
jgi:hypothetical protein